MFRRDFCGFTLRKKEIESICLCIFINTFLVCWVFAVNCISQDWRSFDCISLSAFLIDSPRLLGSIGSSFNTFFSQINEFLQEVTQFQEEKSEALLKRIHPLGHLSDSRHLSLIHSWSLNTVDFKRPHVICCSFFDHLPAHQLQRSTSHSLKSLFSYLSSQQVLNRWFNSLRQPNFRWLHR